MSQKTAPARCPSTEKGRTSSEKRPFELTGALGLIREAVKAYPKAALFELYEEGFRSVFEQLVACMISIRTRDEVTLVVARQLFEQASTPKAVTALGAAKVEALIRPSSFSDGKARQIVAIAERAEVEFGGLLPCDRQVLLSFHGVGPKCANLALGIACSEPCISVDIHVHRIVNRWGIVETTAPEKTMTALADFLPKSSWIELNALLVPFGKHICTGKSPHCSTCPVVDMCQQVGVTSHR